MFNLSEIEEKAKISQIDFKKKFKWKMVLSKHRNLMFKNFWIMYLDLIWVKNIDLKKGLI